MLDTKILKAFGDYMQAVAHNHDPTRRKVLTQGQHKTLMECRVQKTAPNFLSENAGYVGGYTVPVELRLGIDNHLAERSVFRRCAAFQPMRTSQMDLASFDLTAAHATGVTPLVGGFTLTWGNVDRGNESEPSLQGGSLVARSLNAYCVASNTLIADGGEVLGAYLWNGFNKAIIEGTDRAFWQGIGTNQPLGVLNAPGTVYVSRSGSSHIIQADCTAMMAALLPASMSNAVWGCSGTALGDIAKTTGYQSSMAPTVGSPLAGFLYGRPLYVTSHLPALGAKGDLLLFDPTMYCIGERWIEVSMSDQAYGYYQANQSVYRILWWGDGQPLVKNSFKDEDGATTVGCYVGLSA